MKNFFQNTLKTLSEILFIFIIILAVFQTNAATSESANPVKSDPDNPDISKLIESAPSAIDNPEAMAVILFDKLELTYTPEQGLTKQKTFVVKILKQGGLEKFNKIEVWFDSSKEDAKLVFAKVWEVNGNKISPEEKDITFVNPTAANNYKYATPLKILSVKIPGLRVNSILEYKISISSKDKGVMDRTLFGRENFQDVYPILKKQVIITTPGDLELNHVECRELPAPEISETENSKVYKWLMTDVPQVNDLPYSIAIENQVPCLYYSTFKTWDDVKGFIKFRGIEAWKSDINSENYLKELTQKFSESGDTLEVLKKMYHHVSLDIHQIDWSSEKYDFASHSPLETNQSMFGTCFDKITLMQGLLGAMNIPYATILVNNRNLEIEKSFPSPAQFNHAVIKISLKNQPIYLDPGTPFILFGSLAPNLYDSDALCIEPGNDTIVRTPSAIPEQNTQKIYVFYNLDILGNLRCEIQTKTSGYSDYNSRISFQNKNLKEIKSFFMKKLDSLKKDVHIIAWDISDPGDLNSPMSMKLAFDVKNFAFIQNGLYSFSLFQLPLDFSNIDDYEIDLNRSAPVFLDTPRTRDIIHEITYPIELNMSYFPPSLHMQSQGIKTDITCSMLNQKIMHQSEVSFSKEIITKEELNDFSNQYNRLDQPKLRNFLLRMPGANTAL